MYVLLGLDAVLRITAALLFLFVAVPALARRRPAELDPMQWFWWCAAAGITALTILGQILTLLNVFSAATLLLAIAVVIVVVRAHVSDKSVGTLLRDIYRAIVLCSLHTLEGRMNLRRHVRRWRRRMRRTLSNTSDGSRWRIAGWVALIAIAAALRLYRPFVSANLGFSDTYVHLYLLRLLEQGRQVDPAWGPYPRGMHFLLAAIRELTNVDAILLMNFFGAVVGVLLTLAVADTARRLSGRFLPGLIAGLLFATMIGGAPQYFLLGGSVATNDVEEARRLVGGSYENVPPTNVEFDVLLTVFQRQTATLPQELALVFLFPAAMFLFDFLRGAGRGHLLGYLFCTSTIAATHPGVAVPLVLLSGVTVIAVACGGRAAAFHPGGWAAALHGALAGAAGIVLGSTWMLAYIFYPHAARAASVASASSAGSTMAYYFPFLRRGADAEIVTWMALTPFLLACLAIAIAMLVRAYFATDRAPLLWCALAVLTFTLTHLASRYSLPEIVEVRRNASWLAMSLAVLLGVASAEFLRWRITQAILVVMVALWLWRVPGYRVHDRLIQYSGYSATAKAVLEIERNIEPFTWTLVTYGQEFPMVMGKGFHLAAVEFLERYDPAARRLDIPTPYVFIAVEKTPHPFQINAWTAQFSREEIERRLQTWCFLYQLNHRDMHVFREDEHVRVYMIQREGSSR